MPESHTHDPILRLTLQSRLADLALVWPWVEALALQYVLSDQTRFAINLCLEEALSNIIRHGYLGDPSGSIAIDCASSEENWLQLVVEDSAPPFVPPAPLDPHRTVAPATLEDIEPGGQGIVLMRRFAGSLLWEQLPAGNRLTLGFQIAPPAPAAN